MSSPYIILLLTIVALLSEVTIIHALKACLPVTYTFTRATGASAEFDQSTKIYKTKYPTTNANFANVDGALKYTITECIDAKRGYTLGGNSKCHRKNRVTYIQFFEFTVCNPIAARKYFSGKELGAYNTFDDGQCNGDSHCQHYHGSPKLGSFVGWKDDSTDLRNPTKNSMWFSVPGECPSKKRSDKTEQCIKDEPSGKCEGESVPDGVKCTYNYIFLGQVDIDDLNGIRQIDNPATGKKYKDHVEYCNSGEKEFLSGEGHKFVEGLPFWSDPLNQTRNVERVDQLLKLYDDKGKYPHNKPITSSSELRKRNPPCSANVDKCTNDKPCYRDNSMICRSCDGACPVFASLPGDRPTPGGAGSSAVPMRQPSQTTYILRNIGIFLSIMLTLLF